MPRKDDDSISDESESSTSITPDDTSDSDYEDEPPPKKVKKRGTGDAYKIVKSGRRMLHPRYVGDLTESDLHSPEKMKKLWSLAFMQITDQRKKLKTLQQKNRRLENQVTRLKNLVKHLKTVHR